MFRLLALWLGFASVGWAAGDLEAQRAQYAARTQEVIVRLAATVSSGIPVVVRPLVPAQKAKRDVPYQVYYRFTNLTDEPQRIRAVHQISPESAEGHFKKLVCFCFENQTLAPRETKDMPVIFTVAPTLPPAVDTIELSYVIFRSTPDHAGPPAAAGH